MTKAALIALLLKLQSRRTKARDEPLRPVSAAPKPAQRVLHFLQNCSTRVANETWAPQASGTPAEQPHPRDAPESGQASRYSTHPIRAGFAAAGGFRRFAAGHDAHDASGETRGNLPETSRDATRQPQRDETLRCVLERLPFAILLTNALGRIVLANAAVARLFGYSQDELIGASANALVPGLHGDAIPARQGETVSARRKDGTEFPAEITANHASSDGDPLTLTVVIDRTEHYELQRNRLELAHLTRVSTLGELASSLAHELNQPLTAILSNAQAAQRFMATQPINLAEVREILKDLVEDNHRASEVLRRIRALVKKGELEAAPLSLARVIGDVLLLVHSDAIVRGIRVLLALDPGLPPVLGDSVQVQQVILNLLLNAFHAMGPAWCASRCAIADLASLPTKWTSSLSHFLRQSARASVSDSRSAAPLLKCTADVSGPKTIVRKARLSISHCPSPPGQSPAFRTTTMNNAISTVFVVDDDDAVRRALTRLIRSAGYRAEGFASAREFLECGPCADYNACLVLDVQLPDLNGLELQRTLSGAGRPLSIVFITGHGDIPMSVSAMKAGATDFLVKPVSDTDLLNAIETALGNASQALANRIEIESIHHRIQRLTPREREVLALVVEGRLNKQMACELGTAEKTIKVHRARVMKKMEAHSVAELVRVTDKAGIQHPPAH
jgi:PAS domain S-box-containing protein